MYYVPNDYIARMLPQAVYGKLEDGTYAGRILECVGVIAFGETLPECQDNLRSTLEDWILVGQQLDHLQVTG